MMFVNVSVFFASKKLKSGPQGIRGLAAKYEDLSAIPETNIVGGETRLLEIHF